MIDIVFLSIKTRSIPNFDNNTTMLYQSSSCRPLLSKTFVAEKWRHLMNPDYTVIIRARCYQTLTFYI